MSSHEDFLAAVLEHPDDDAPRLIYADWLEEHGESERAEFIRLQVDAARLPEGDPRACDLDSKAEGILAEFETAWLGEWSQRLVRWTFRRGFLDEITILPEVFLRGGEELFRAWPVRRFRFVDRDADEASLLEARAITGSPLCGRIRSLDAPSYVESPWLHFLWIPSHWRGLQELDLREGGGNFLSRLPQFAALFSAPHLKGLQSLSLRCEHNWGPPVEPAFIEHLAAAPFAPHLQSLVLDGLGMTDDALRRLINDPVFAKLERLRLAEARRLSPEMVSAVLGTSRLDSLQDLCIGWECDLTALAAAPRLRELKRLDLWLSNNLVYSRNSWSAFAKGLSPGQLTHLGLAYGILGQESVEELLASPGLSELRGLAVWGGQMVGDQILSHLCQHCSSLTSLDMTRAGVSAYGVGQLASSPLLSRLAHLRFWFDDIWKPTQYAFLGSSHFSPRLKSLELCGWNLGDEGCELLANNRGLCGLTHLNLRSNGVSAAGMKAMLSSPYLKRLTSLGLGSAPSDALQVLADSPGLPRLRQVVIDSRAGDQVIAALRKRFGARLIVDPNI